jgi:predicted lysophospholipase L1 biosynthesis ABC-type transport system permease subunit
VVNDSRYARARDDVPATIFPSALQRTGYGGNHVVVRSDVPPGQLENALREAVGRVSRDLPVPEVSSQVARIAESSARERLFAQLLTIFGVFALLLASIGLHGVVSYSVARRTNEIGLRMAIGARPGAVQWLILRQVLGLSLFGLLLGVPAAWVAGWRLSCSSSYHWAPATGPPADPARSTPSSP